MTVRELRNQLDTLIDMNMGDVKVTVAVKSQDAAPLSHLFVPIENVSYGEVGGWGPLVVSISMVEERE